MIKVGPYRIFINEKLYFSGHLSEPAMLGMLAGLKAANPGIEVKVFKDESLLLERAR